MSDSFRIKPVQRQQRASTRLIWLGAGVIAVTLAVYGFYFLPLIRSNYVEVDIPPPPGTAWSAVQTERVPWDSGTVRYDARWQETDVPAGTPWEAIVAHVDSMLVAEGWTKVGEWADGEPLSPFTFCTIMITDNQIAGMRAVWYHPAGSSPEAEVDQVCLLGWPVDSGQHVKLVTAGPPHANW